MWSLARRLEHPTIQLALKAVQLIGESTAEE